MEDWFRRNFEKVKEDLFTFLKFKSISADPSFNSEITACSKWLSSYLEKIGLKSELLKTPTHPIVFAENKNFCEGKPTVLIYGHYDVQPVDPIEEWKSDPFEPRMEGDEIYARGALDDKGQIFYAICALKALLEKGLPLNVKFCIEGEEESSSSGLNSTLEKYKEKFKADYLLAIDFNMVSSDTPALTLGARGNVSLSLEFIGGKTDLHSGEHGGVAYNPLHALIDLFSLFWDEKGKVAIKGFYDDVKEIPEDQKSKVDLFFDAEKYKQEFGVEALFHEEGYTNVETNWFRPILMINGIGGGYYGPGFKSVIPKKAIAKVSCRIVPDQNPEKIAILLKDFLQKHVKKGIKLKIDVIDTGYAASGDNKSPLAKALERAMEDVFEKPCKYIYCGGSVPVIAKMAKVLNVGTVMMGVGILTDNIHAPNEHFSFSRFQKGFLCVAKALEILGRG